LIAICCKYQDVATRVKHEKSYYSDDRGQIITLGNATTLSAQTLANLFNNGNSVVAQTKPNGDVSLADSNKLATQNAYDALGNLVFKDPAPQLPANPQPTKPSDPLDGITVTYTNANGDARILVPVKDLPKPTDNLPILDNKDIWLSSGGRDLSKGLYNSSPETADLIAKTPSAEEIAQVLKDSAISKDPIDPYGKTWKAIGNFFNPESNP
jgi:hypothetical protein